MNFPKAKFYYVTSLLENFQELFPTQDTKLKYLSWLLEFICAFIFNFLWYRGLNSRPHSCCSWFCFCFSYFLDAFSPGPASDHDPPAYAFCVPDINHHTQLVVEMGVLLNLLPRLALNTVLPVSTSE
jgi:hypothetical protein